jgi:hypothetical protein
LEIARRLGRVHQALDRAVDHEARLAERRDDRAKPADRLARAGRADRHRMRIGRRRNHDMERPGAQPQQGQLGKVNIQCARLRFR